MSAAPLASSKPAAPKTGCEWWRGAVIYQVYPRSFRDTNGDGVGDLSGIIQGLDHIADLGVDGVWLSPFFTSPMRDYGYDVADYCDVDPLFGTLADFDRLIEKAHRLGLKVIIDQVYSHTSDEHPWFEESRRDKDNPKADWYVWADPKEDGTPPNNWLSVFGGVAWEWDTRRGQYYLHNFLTSQPDLNLHNSAVQDGLIDVARFWLDRGVDGFRLDAINFGMHDPQLRDNAPAARGRRPLLKPYDFQEHRHNLAFEHMPGFLERLRAAIDDYGDIYTVAEIANPNPLPAMKSFTQGDRRLNSAYSFDFLYAPKIHAETVASSLSAWKGAAGEGWPGWAFSNHDAPRAVSRWNDHAPRDQAAKFYALLLLALRGNVFLYQGEELGLPQAEIAFEDLKDPEAIANWPITLGRDGARTPIPWRKDAPHAGFSMGKPWLPVPPEHQELSIDGQTGDPNSVLHFVQEAIRLRKTTPSLRLGDIAFQQSADNILVFERTLGADVCLCVFNLGPTQAAPTLTNIEALETALSTGLGASAHASPSAPPRELPPMSGYIATKRSAGS